MSAEQLVEQIIDQALQTGAEKADLADQYSDRAITAAQGLFLRERAGLFLHARRDRAERPDSQHGGRSGWCAVRIHVRPDH